MERYGSCFMLRPWLPGDEDSLVLHANNYNIWLNLRDIFPHPYTFTDARTWVQIAGTIPNQLNLAIEVEGKAVGGIGLILKEDVYKQSAEIGYWLGEPFWNRGIITEAVKIVSDYAFSQYAICRLYAGIFEYNKGSMRVLEKAGYTLEAIHRKAITKNNILLDEYVYVLLREYP